jgi:hypothetical protein
MRRADEQRAELVLTLGPEGSEGLLVVPHLAASPAARLLDQLLGDPGNDVRTITLRPPEGLGPGQLADWHQDAWWALPEAVRGRLGLASGPTAAFMRRAAKPARGIFVVTPPIPPPGVTPQQLERLLAGDGSRPSPRLEPFANPQAKLLWRKANTSIPLSDGIPGRSRAWSAWVDRIASRYALFPPERLEDAAAEIAGALGLDPQAAHLAAGVAEPDASESPASQALERDLANLNWLDQMVLTRAREREGALDRG